MAVPYYNCQLFSGASWAATGSGGAFSTKTVNGASSLSTSSGKGRVTWVSGGGNTLCTYVLASSVALAYDSHADGEVLVDIEQPNGTNATGFVVGRAATAGNFEAYIVREVTPGSPTGGWALYYYKDNNPEGASELFRFNPVGVTAYPVRVKYAFVGSTHAVKIWNAGSAEPAWNDARNVRVIIDATKLTAGGLGVGAWGLGTTGEYAAFDNLAVACWNEIYAPATGIPFAGISDNVDRTSYTASVTFKAGTVLWIAVANTKAGTPDTPTVSCTGMTVGAALITSLDYDTAGSPSRRLTVFPALVTADIDGVTSANNLTVSFGANTQTGCITHIMPIGGGRNTGSDGSNAFVNTASSEPTTNATSISVTVTRTFPSTGGVVGSMAHTANEVSSPGSGFTEFADSQHSGPTNALDTEFKFDTDTAVGFSWSSNVRSAAIAAETPCGDPAAEYVLPPNGAMFPRPVAVPRAATR